MKLGALRNRKWPMVSIVVGLAIVLAATLAVMNLSAGEADGSPAAQKTDGAAETGNEEQAAETEGEEASEEEKAPVPVEVTAAQIGTVSSYITSSANLVAENQVKVLAEVEGRVSRMLVEEGDYVGKGQALATLVRDDAEITLRKAELKETNARMAWERSEDLAAKELISREEHDKFVMDHEIARQERAEAEWRLEKTIIRAPFGGRLSQRLIQVGQHVRPGDELFQVTDLDPLISHIYLPERDVLGLEEGRQVRIGLNADDSVRFAGHIRQISPVVDTATGTVKVTVEAETPPPQVRPGSFVTIDIVRETHEGAVLLPREAVLRELQSAHVFVAEGGAAARREIRLGLEEGELVEVLAGIEAGERVIIAGQGGLKDGSPVKILGAEEDLQAAG